SSAAATPSETCWSTWSIQTSSSMVRRRTLPLQCRSCPGVRTRRLRSAATSFSDLKSLSNDRTAAIGWAARSVCRPLSGLGYPRHAFRDPDNVTLDHFRTGDFLDLAGRAGAVVDADALPQPQIADVLLARHHLLGDRHTNQRRHGKAADQQSQK